MKVHQPVWRTKGKYRKEMKRGHSKKIYHERSNAETIFYVIKKTMGDDIMSKDKGAEQ
jgi:hypothetical protein